MKSAWSERDAQAIVDRYALGGIGPDLALRIYSTRLLGSEPRLVLHGGGNTSIKALTTDLLGEVTEVVCVKASGGDMATLDETRLPALRLDRLHKLRTRDSLPDEDMPLVLRDALIDPTAPNPSVETLLHAFLPHKFVDHTHANAVLSITDQEDSDLFCVDVYGSRMGIVPYVMPGFGLAVRAAGIYELKPKIEGLILQKHGIVTFGSSARESYERMIEMVSLAEDRLAKNRKAVFVPAPMPGPLAPLAEIAPILRGVVSVKDERVEGAWRRPILDFRSDPAILNFVNGTELARYAQAGVVTPDHVIRTKIWPLILGAPEQNRAVEFKRNALKAVTTFTEYYKSYFARHNARVGGDRKMVDPQPRVVLVPGLGLFGLGRTSRDAMIAADIATCAIETITDAEAVGRFTSISEAEMFEMEYWPQEQAKLVEAQASQTSRSPARSRSSPAQPAPSASPPPRPSWRPAPRWRCLISTRPQRLQRRARSVLPRSRCTAMSPTRRRYAQRSIRWSPPSAASTSWCRTQAPPGRAASARSTRKCCTRASS